MQINVIAVTLSQSPGNKYQIAEVVYKDDRAETKTKKLMSFANPATYAVFKDAKQGETYDITQVKNDKGFWDWTSATKADGANAATNGAAKAVATTRSTYETAEERAVRQVLIVKQSSLSTAVALLTKDGVAPSTQDVIDTAQEFTDWVFDNQVKEVE